MPIHDWSRVEAVIFHDFHQAWTIGIRDALNGGGLPPGYFAMAEQIVSGPIPDVVTLQRRPGSARPQKEAGGIALAERLTRVAASGFVTPSHRSLRNVRAAKRKLRFL